MKPNTSTYWSLKLSIGIKGISFRKFPAFIVVTYKRQISAASKSTIGWPTLSILISPRTKCWYQNWFSKNDPVDSEFVFSAIAILQTGALLKMFSWKNCFCLARMMKVFTNVSKYLYSTRVYGGLSIFLVIIILVSNTTGVKRTINKPKSNVGAVTNYVKIKSGSDNT